MLTPKTIVAGAVVFILGIAVAAIFMRGGQELQAGAAAQPELILFSEPDFQGRELHLFDSTVDLPFEDLVDGTKHLWNDNIGSLIVAGGTWRLYQHGRMNTALDDTPKEAVDVYSKAPAGGWSCLLSASSRGPLKIATPELGGFGSDISSIELVSPFNLPDWTSRAR